MIDLIAGSENEANCRLQEALHSWRRVWSLLDVLRFAASRFVGVIEFVAQMELIMGEAATLQNEETWERSRESIGRAAASCDELGLPVAADALHSLQKIFRSDSPGWPQEHHGLFRDARRRIMVELKTREFLMLDPQRARFYKSSEPRFGLDVAAKFARAGEDIENARDCLALEQGTACVFHLMRVMEIAVQRFGRRLRASVNPSKDSWNQIVDAINGRIKQMPRKTTRQRTRNAEYATAAAHLNAVRIAWRNEVMHPKQTYTLEEAKQIFNNVETFVRDLARII